MPAITSLIEEQVFLPKWGCTLSILFTPDGPYCVLRQLCQVVGVEDVRQQYRQLLAREATQNYTTKLPMQTLRGGRQVTYCIHMDILAWWLAGLNEKRIRAEFAPKLVRFQKDIVQAASNILFGIPEENMPPEAVARGKIIQLQDWLGPSSQPFDTSLPDDLNDEDD
jgi:hypothetical protein